MIFFSRASSTAMRPSTSSRRFLSRTNSNGVCASSSPIFSLNSVESSSPIEASSEAGRIPTLVNRATFSPAMPSSSLSSSSVGSRPSSSLICDATDFRDFIAEMHWQSNRFALVGQSTLDRLFDPPHRIRAQLGAFRRIETLDRFGQPNVALGDQVKQGQTEIAVFVRDSYNKPQIRVDHTLARFGISLFDLLCQLDLVLSCQKGNPPDLS